MQALGLMSGTSMDGIDIALVDTDGAAEIVLGPTGFHPYQDGDRTLLREAVAEAASLDRRDARPPAVAAAEERVTTLHAAAVNCFIVEHGLQRDRIEVVGFHGQTVLHRPEHGLTVQIGDAAALACHCALDVVADFRAADVAAGGQGAPLVPAYHRALAEASRLSLPVVLLNIGGVANISFLPGKGADPVACDTGPGNALIDDLMLERTGIAVDAHGATAARGIVDGAVLRQLLAHPYFDLPPPKSLDRNAWSRAPVAGLGLADAAATLTAFTVESIANTIARLPAPPTEVIVCGGGARNRTMMRQLAVRLACPLRAADDLGWSGEAIEAQAFAYLAVRSRLGLPITFPTTTGVSIALPGGVFHPART